MTAFLGKTARYLIDHHGSELSEVCVVMPNRRAGIFLNRFLAAEMSKPVWAPQLFSIEEFMEKLSGLREIESIHLLTELYTVYKATEGQKAKPFDEFLSWGPQLLSDFNEVDRNMVNASDLFGYLNEVRAINLWNLDKTPLTEFQKNYLAFYNALGTYHAELTKRLTDRGEGYQGLLFRNAAERVESGQASVPWKQVVFAGFNALTTAEIRTMTAIAGMGKATFLWDVDQYYLERPHQEAGRFLRQWLSSFPGKEKNWISSELLTDAKEIEIMGVPDTVGQVKYCGEILKQSVIAPDERTAVVLPDETLLIPLLNALPAEVTDVNITMGLPLNTTPLSGLLESLFQMHLRTAAMQGGDAKRNHYYHHDVVKVMQHPLVFSILSRLMPGNLRAFNEFVDRIRTGGKIFIGKQELPETGLIGEGHSFLESFFEPWNTPASAISGLRNVLQWIRDTLGRTSHPSADKTVEDASHTDMEYAFAFTKIVHQLGDVLNLHPDYFSLPILHQFFRQLSGNATLPFYGEPLKGTQVMGMLETRTLDFDNLIILSCNEGLLPSSKTAHSFIPFDIRSEFGLPTHQQKEAVYAYHFYRLLQRAKKVWLLYGSEPDTLGGGERSRYLQQIMHELPLYNPAIRIHEHLLTSPVLISTSRPEITIRKADVVLEKLVKKAKDGLAPTALNAFRSCSLKFYFSEIAGIREPEDASDNIDPKSLGTAIHKALQLLYLPHLMNNLSDADIKEMTQKADQAVHQAFGELFPENSLKFGKNLLLMNVARFMIKNFLKAEMDLVGDLKSRGDHMQVSKLEELMSRKISASTNGEKITVVVKGFVDRIDRIGGTMRVIDYKTGFTADKELNVKDWSDIRHDPVLDKAFQLLVYAWLLGDSSAGLPVHAGIISLRTISAGLMAVNLPDDGNALQSANGGAKKREKNIKIGLRDLDLFEDQLNELISELLDAEKPFVQTEEVKRCERCVYRSICGR